MSKDGPRVLIIRGYGTFGGRIARLLAQRGGATLLSLIVHYRGWLAPC
jgi:hypothetical protein